MFCGLGEAERTRFRKKKGLIAAESGFVTDNTPIPGLQMNLLESYSSFVIPQKNKHKINKSTKRSNNNPIHKVMQYIV